MKSLREVEQREWRHLKRYMKAVVHLLSSDSLSYEIDEEDCAIYAGGAWVQMTRVGHYILGTTVHDPGVRYHSDGSGTPPSADPVEIHDEELGVDGGLFVGFPYQAVRALVLWHRRREVDELLSTVGEGIMLEEKIDEGW